MLLTADLLISKNCIIFATDSSENRERTHLFQSLYIIKKKKG